MKKRKELIYLQCAHCKEETPHNVEYINGDVYSMACRTCGRELTLNRDIMKEWYSEVYDRVTTKPTRLTEEYKESRTPFVVRLPFRMASKPYRLMRDLNDTQKTLRYYKNKQKKSS
ncbi:hypothetical protein SAMN05421781_1461 [Marinococcus luteus]|uniref:Bh protein n=1 Tax=Marinococcus luteus TaxID=1122204 RepID=A0A1H2TKW2_9BACI|nr:hypothetical protein [Marinococcus luteus]SDW44646.1 hypothetical protein SAMN05421781_1461 [Marinococcus luteus]